MAASVVSNVPQTSLAAFLSQDMARLAIRVPIEQRGGISCTSKRRLRQPLLSTVNKETWQEQQLISGGVVKELTPFHNGYPGGDFLATCASTIDGAQIPPHMDMPP